MLWVTRKKAGKIASPTSYTRNSSFLCIIAEKKMDDLYFLGYAMTKSGKKIDEGNLRRHTLVYSDNIGDLRF